MGDRRQPVRRLRPGAGDPRRADDGGRASAGGGSRRRGRTSASTISPAGSPRNSPTSTGLRGACARLAIRAMSELSHVDDSGSVRMVDVGAKPLSRRRAVARADVRMAPETARKLRELPKGDALATAQLAGIMAAKRTSELIPLCHPLPLSHVEVALEVGETRRRDRRGRGDDGADRRRDGGAHGRRRSPRSRSTTWRRRSTRTW